MRRRKHIIVVGSGIAGLIAAIRLSSACDVTLVTKLELSESNTRWAQGGIAAAMFPDDSIASHVDDTLRAGAGLCNHEAVKVLCAEGPERIRDLIAFNVSFDRKNGELARGLEAAHSYPRVLHANGDATGLSIETALVRVLRCSSVHILEHTFACDLILDGEQVAGLKVLHPGGVAESLHADAIVLASGGAGQLFLHTTNPACATGDGVAIALRAGAQVADAEFYQFHPTALDINDTFLISEAVRGEGAVLLDRQGDRFMRRLHPAAELAPRDVVARSIALQMEAQDGQSVLLDATKLGAEFLRLRFPSIDAASRKHGFDWSREPLPVTPAAHYWMGGVRTDLFGRTSLPRLFAVGEVACTSIHGANRLASNSLLESLVFAWRCADFLLESNAVAGHTTPAAFASAPVDDLDSLLHLGSLPGARSPTPSFRFDNPVLDNPQTLQRLLWKNAGIERNGDDLARTLAQLHRWHVDGQDVASRETANLLLIARTLVASALRRQESRGAHFRRDFPETSHAWERSIVYAQEVALPC